ncbi:hypothetical protein QQZ08_012085 [Neonectria magnoliae]|uniref:Uncharacterized protein n=1 Tax=Neonectria magnoliae TaxID=2732573 RepID=A0ABR1H5B1_9HYPO
MRLTTLASVLALGRLGLAGPTKLDLKVIDSGCRPYQAPGCCVPTLCQCKDGRLYLFNEEDKNAGGSGCNPPWGVMGDSIGAVPGYCC